MTTSTNITSGYSDDTADRIRAFWDSMRLLRGLDHLEDSDEFQHGRDLIEKLAANSAGIDEPDIRLSPTDCAAILWVLTKLEPIARERWWNDPKDAPSHVCGLQFVLRAMESSLRNMGGCVMSTNKVTPIMAAGTEPPRTDKCREMGASYIAAAIESLLVYEAALSTSKCEIAQSVGKRLGLEGMANDLDYARETLEKGDPATGAVTAPKAEPTAEVAFAMARELQGLLKRLADDQQLGGPGSAVADAWDRMTDVIGMLEP